MNQLINDARAWVLAKHPGQSEHLLRAEYWLMQFAPDAALPVQLATLTHDMERAFPGNDAPNPALMKHVMDTTFNLAHGRRSARFVAQWLQEQGADEAFTHTVSELIVMHEYGGWPEADQVQAADSISFLEVNLQKFIDWIPRAEFGWSYERVIEKFNWMYERITVPEAIVLATPLYEEAIRQIELANPGNDCRT